MAFLLSFSMRFANKAGAGPRATADYVADLLALLGDLEPFGVLAATPAGLAAVIAGSPPAQLTRPEGPGRWSVAGVLQHLADSEVVNGYRIRLMLAADNPPIPAYDQDAWAAALGYDQADATSALRDFTAARAANLRLWRSLDQVAMDRAGIHAERGSESVGRLIRLLAAHDLVHARQVRRILAGGSG
jgi:hypothetical protein